MHLWTLLLNLWSQECIPVGCVTSAAVKGVSAQGRGVWRGLYTTPTVDRILDTYSWKHYLSTTTVADDKNVASENLECLPHFEAIRCFEQWDVGHKSIDTVTNWKELPLIFKSIVNSGAPSIFLARAKLLLSLFFLPKTAWKWKSLDP